MKITVYDTNGKKTEEAVTSKIFDGKTNADLLSEVIYIAQANRRQAPAKTKDRGEVAGSGIKPWRQKGTGRARAGSRRSPIWRGGGVTFGPTGDQNFEKNIPTKKKIAALQSALANFKTEDIYSVKSVKIEKPNTKKIVALLEKLQVKRNVLIIADKIDETLDKSIRNLPQVTLIDYRNFNVLDALEANKLVFLGESLNLLTKKLVGSPKEENRVVKKIKNETKKSKEVE